VHLTSRLTYPRPSRLRMDEQAPVAVGKKCIQAHSKQQSCFLDISITITQQGVAYKNPQDSATAINSFINDSQEEAAADSSMV